MAYEKPITINEAIQKIQKKKFVLPSIQREFVWESAQIEKLFDSLLRDYPISTFLFWNVDKTKIKEFQFYEFLQHYHERDAKHNPKASIAEDEDVTAILDGQQRLTSLYIGLRGTYAEKLQYYSWDNNNAFPKKKLYINLLKPADNSEMLFDIKFLTQEEIVKVDGGFYWFEVGKILEFKDYPQVMKYLMQSGLTDTSKYPSEQGDFALNTLNELYNVIHQKEMINFFLEKSIELDKVLQIFIRINSGGTKLSYSDLLLSIASAQWKSLDAREEIHDFVDEINKYGQGYNFDKDLIMKSCLVLGDFPDVKFNVDNFSKSNMLKIESIWVEIKDAISIAVQLVSNYGFTRETLATTNALVPIAYYLLKMNADESFLTSRNYELDRENIRQWLIRVILKRVFSGTPDNLYPQLRKLINEGNGSFPLKSIIEFYRGTNKSIIFSDDDINALCDLSYGNKFTFSALSLLYPELNMTYTFHEDHIHPKAMFTETRLRKRGIPEDKIKLFIKNVHKLPNLQLLEGNQNKQKNATEFELWLKENFKTESSKTSYLKLNHIPDHTSLALDDYNNFFNARKDLLISKFRELLEVN